MSSVTEEELRRAVNNYQNKVDQFIIAGIESSAKVIESCLIILGFLLALSLSVLKNNSPWTVIIFFLAIALFFIIYLFYRFKISKLYGAIVDKYMAIGGIPEMG
ncbi:hypothetical protein HZA71_02750, partial [Candidatus Falkowbacteria bacterium]|nr:hypothetical protein [Candidatus Falkowbacteria bacterium]